MRQPTLETTTWLALGLSALSAAANGCTFESPASSCFAGATSDGFISCALNKAPFVEPSSDTRQVVYQNAGRIRVIHGQSCVSAARAASEEAFAFRIAQSETIPPSYGDSATVFTNGWKLRYSKGDHHVQGFGSAIINVRESRTADGLKLEWEAGGLIADQNGDDPYEWCYSYTILGWARSNVGFDAVANERNLSFIQASEPGNSSALHQIDGLTRNIYGNGVILPQGFAMMWADHTDRHVLQAGFDLGQHYTAGNGQMGWTSRALFKDNDAAHDFYVGQLVSTMSYSSPETFHPAEVSLETQNGFVPRQNSVKLTPYAGDPSCATVGHSTPAVEHYRVDVPYAYAVPVLSGWELGYVCTDHHVREMGAAITEWHFERNADRTAGTIYYTVEHPLIDDSDNVSYTGVSIDVLGLKSLSPVPPSVFQSIEGSFVSADETPEAQGAAWHETPPDEDASQRLANR